MALRQIRSLPAGWFIHLAIVRLASQWRSILTLIIGVLLAAVIGASIPLYTAAISQVGMVQRLERNSLEDRHIHTRTSIDADVESGFSTAFSQYDAAVRPVIEETVSPFAGWYDRTVTWGESAPLLVVRDGTDVEATRLRVAYYDGLPDEVNLTDGVWPGEPQEGDVDLEIALHTRLADALQLQVGDTFVLDQRGWETSQPVTTRVTALFNESDLDSAYWMNPSPLRDDASGQWQIDANVFTTRESFDRINAEFIPQTRALVGWRVFFTHEALDFMQIQQAQDAMQALPTTLETALAEATGEEAPSLVYETNLPSILAGYRDEVTQLRVPFSLLMLQLGALVLFFLVVMGALVRRSERREVAMMQSRGAPDGQILLLRSVETVIVCAFAVLAAPFLARWLLIILVPMFTTIERLTLSINRAAFVYAGAASLVALIVLIVTLIPLLRQPLVTAGGIGLRSGTRTWWQRYYLDVVLLIIGLGALWRLVSQDALTVQTGGSTQADPLLLLAPTLLVFALGSVLLRLFPFVMNAIAGYISGGQHRLEWMLSSWQVSREPLHYGRITFLLALAISIGWFAISFQTTVTESQDDQARYAVGSDLRLDYNALVQGSPTTPPADRFMALNGVRAATRVTRLHNVPIALDGGLDEGTILAVDSKPFAQVAFWREDLGMLAISDTQQDLDPSGISLPADTASIQLDAFYLGINTYLEAAPGDALESLPVRLAQGEVELTANVRDANDARYQIPLIPQTAAFDEALADRTEARKQASISELLEAERQAMREDNPEVSQAELDAITLSDLDIDPSLIENFQLDLSEQAELAAEYFADGWIPFSADLTALQPAPAAPLWFNGLTLNISLRYAGPFFNDLYASSVLYLRDLRLTSADDAQTEVDWFAREDWSLLAQPTSSQGVFYELPADLPEAVQDDANLRVAWNQRSEISSLTLFVNEPGLPAVQEALRPALVEEEAASGRVANALPALVSRSFAQLNNVETGHQFDLFIDNTELWFEVSGVVDYYPTLYSDEQPFVVVEQGPFLQRLQRQPGATTFPNEIWIDLEEGTSPESVLVSLDAGQNASEIIASHRRDAVRSTLATDPLVVGLIGLLFFSFLVGIALSVVSLATYASLTVQARRTELSVLRAIGLSPDRITLSIAIEQSMVMLTAVVLGMLIGALLSTQVLPALSRNTTGADVTPPFLITFGAVPLIVYVLITLLILLVALGFSALLVRRLTSAESLRQVEV